MKVRLIGSKTETNPNPKIFFAIPIDWPLKRNFFLSSSDSSEMVKYITHKSNEEKQLILFKDQQEAEDYLIAFGPPGKVNRATGICRILIPAGVEFIEADTFRASMEGTKNGVYEESLKEKFDFHRKNNKAQLKYDTVKVVNFKAGDGKIFLLGHKSQDDGREASLKTTYFRMSYNTLWNEKSSEPLVEKMARIYHDYAHPTGGWFLSGHWSRSEANINFCDNDLIKTLREFASTEKEPMELANFLINKIANSKISMNPEGSFMRRTLFILEMLLFEQTSNKYDKKSKNEDTIYDASFKPLQGQTSTAPTLR